jgi:hypothetical protein
LKLYGKSEKLYWSAAHVKRFTAILSGEALAACWDASGHSRTRRSADLILYDRKIVTVDSAHLLAAMLVVEIILVIIEMRSRRTFARSILCGDVFTRPHRMMKIEQATNARGPR